MAESGFLSPLLSRSIPSVARICYNFMLTVCTASWWVYNVATYSPGQQWFVAEDMQQNLAAEGMGHLVASIVPIILLLHFRPTTSTWSTWLRTSAPTPLSRGRRCLTYSSLKLGAFFNIQRKIYQTTSELITVWGVRSWKRFCKMFSESPPCLLAQHSSYSTAQRPA